MNQFSRNSSSKSHKIINITRPFSFFDFIEKEFNGLQPLKRIMSQMRQQDCKTLVLEEINESVDLNEENEDLKIYDPNYLKSMVFRMSFFKDSFVREIDLKTIINDNFLGYAIVKCDNFKDQQPTYHIFESVTQSSRHSNNFIRGAQQWFCQTIDCQFSIYGYLYAQQNGKTNVCAHVALRTVLSRYHKKGDITYREMNKILGVDHIAKKAAPGLTKDQMVEVIKSVGVECYVGAFEDVTDRSFSFQKLIYGCIESGFPAIVFFGTASGEYHAIPVFGHTFNEDTWVPNAEISYFRLGLNTSYIPSESWMSMFIAHDDNFGSNFCIPHRFLNSKRICKKESGQIELCKMEREGVVYIIGTMSGGIKLRPIVAEALGAHYLFSLLQQMPNKERVWFKRLREHYFENRLILRPIIVTKKSYLNHLSSIKDWDNNSMKKDVLKAIEEFIGEEPYWLIELSVPELFPANKRKIGEVLIRANTIFDPSNPFDNFFIARLPEYFVFYSNGPSDSPKYEFIPSGISGHVRLYSGEFY